MASVARNAYRPDARWRWVHDRACLVDNDSTSGSQGFTGRQVMVTAQQKSTVRGRAEDAGNSTLTTGWTGQQQLRSARRGGAARTRRSVPPLPAAVHAESSSPLSQRQTAGSHPVGT
jgi:hypothetical protein